MSVSQIGSSTPLPKNYHINQNTIPTAEDIASFEASLGATSEANADNSHDTSQKNSDGSVPAASWDAVRDGFNHEIFDHNRRELAYYDQRRKEIDYGNKP